MDCEPKRKIKKARPEAKKHIAVNKLTNLVSILEKKTDRGKIDAFYRLLLRAKTLEIVLKDDNYLKTHATVELYRFRNFCAYLKMLYAIRLSKTRKFILKAFFHKFKDLISDFIPLTTLALKRCIKLRITFNDNYHQACLGRVFYLWKDLSVLTRPNSLLFDKDRRNLNLVNFLSTTCKKRKIKVFRMIEKYLIGKKDEEFLKETNDNLAAINSVIKNKNSVRGVEKLNIARSVSELESLYEKFYSQMRDNLTKEIKLYKNTSSIKGAFLIYSRELINKQLFKRFTHWKSRVELMKIQYINAKIEKYSTRKINLNLALVAKIVDKVSESETNLKNLAFERLTLHCKLKGTLKDYGTIYKNVPDLLQDKDQKEMCRLIRQSYIKPITILKLRLMLARKISSKSLLIKKKKQSPSQPGFALNSAFLKWKKKVIDQLGEPARRTYSLTSLIRTINISERRSMNVFLRRLEVNKLQNESEVRILEDEKIEICIVLEKIENRKRLLEKRKAFFEISTFVEDKLMRREKAIKQCLMSKYLIERYHNKAKKTLIFKRWINYSKITKTIVPSETCSGKDIFSKTIILKRTLILAMKGKVFFFFKRKIERLKPLPESRRIDHYININQAKACLELERTEKEIDRMHFQNRVKLFNTDVLCKLFYKKVLNEGKLVYFKRWRFTTEEALVVGDNLDILLNERETLLQEKSQLEVSLGDFKQHYDRVREEMNEFKKSFCKKCLQTDELEVFGDKSLPKNDFYNKSQQFGSVVSKSNEFCNQISNSDVSNEDGEFIEPNKLIGNEMKLHEEMVLKKNDSNLKFRIVEIENKINTLKSEYDQKVLSNEKFLSVYEDKKKELVLMKKEILSKMTGSVGSKKSGR